MEQKNKNIIRREIVNFRFDDGGDGIAIQQNIAAWCRDILNPQIDALIETFKASDEIIFIPQIKIDIDIDNKAAWQNEVTEKIMQQLKEKLDTAAAGNTEGITVKTQSQNFSDSLLYYLKHGFLPWNAQIKNKDEFKTAFAAWLSVLSSAEIKYFLQEIDNAEKTERLMQAAGEKSTALLIATVSNQSQNYVSALLRDIKLIAETVSKQKAISVNKYFYFIQKFILLCLKTDITYPPGSVEKLWVDDIIKTEKLNAGVINTDLIKTAELKNIIHQHQRIKKEMAGKTDWINELPSAKKIKSTEKNKSKNKQAGNGKTITDEQKKELAEGIFINNTGAIIIAPFLTALFEKTGIDRDNKIIDEDAALILIHYCVTGNTSPAEFELVLPKILCGIMPEQAVNTNKKISKKYLNEANEMLASVIEYWNVLKDTSIDALRETFLQREGKLSFSNDKWLLQVEQKPYDMLLQHIPWNISMVRLPWMQHVITTEWAV